VERGSQKAGVETSTHGSVAFYRPPRTLTWCLSPHCQEMSSSSATAVKSTACDAPASNAAVTAPSFFSVSDPTLIAIIESQIRVQWHWDRDDEVDPRSAQAADLMLGGCHCIVQMQVAEQSKEEEDAQMQDSSAEEQKSSSTSTEEEPSRETSASKRRKISSDRFVPAAENEAAAASSDSTTSSTVPTIPPVIDGVLSLDSLPSSFVFTHILTPRVLSRATILIPHSAKFHRLFYTYYDLFIVQQQTEHAWRTEGCPVWLHRFELNLFNQRLERMRQISLNQASEASGQAEPQTYPSPFSDALEKALTRQWRASPSFDFDLKDVPQRFPIFIANYSETARPPNASSTAAPSSSPDAWVGDLLVLPLRTIHAVLSSSPSSRSIRLKYFLGFYTQLPAMQKEDESGFAVGHGPGRREAREYEAAAAWNQESGETSKAAKDEWSGIRMDEAAWRLWRGEQQPKVVQEGDAASTVAHLPIAIDVKLKDKSPAEITHQLAQSRQLLQDLHRHSCALVRGIFPSSMQTSQRTLAYLHRLMRLPPDFSLTSTSPFHALAFHDARYRSQFGVRAEHLRRDAKDHASTHVQASHGNTAYGAYCAPAVEAALFLQPLVKMIWTEWELGVTSSGDGSLGFPPSPRLRTIEVGYQAPLPEMTAAPGAIAATA
jgi:hypothetical protein